MKQFTFERNQRTFLGGMMVLGFICLIMSYFAEPAVIADAGIHQRFWSNFLHNATFFTGMAFMITFVLAAFITAYSGWHVTFKRLWESISLFLVPGIVLMLILGIGNYMGFHHLYHWADADAVASDTILQGKSSFLNNNWYMLGTLILGGIWAFIATRMRKLSVQEDEQGKEVSNFAFHRKTRMWAAIFLPIAAFTGPALIWQWIMSVDAHWYSTLFAWYCMSSWWLAGCALTLILIIYLKIKGYFDNVTNEHLHDLAKYMFAFSIFWTYCWFSQYMLIWYANIGEETIYFRERLDNYPVLFYGNLVINFLLPFLILLRNTTKRRYGTLIFASLLVLIGHWVDYFYMIKPGTLITAKEAAGHSHGTEAAAHGAVQHGSSFVEGFSLPGLIEIGIFIGFLGAFIYFIFSQLQKASMVAENDPYLEESVHHEVQVYE